MGGNRKTRRENDTSASVSIAPAGAHDTRAQAAAHGPRVPHKGSARALASAGRESNRLKQARARQRRARQNFPATFDVTVSCGLLFSLSLPFPLSYVDEAGLVHIVGVHLVLL